MIYLTNAFSITMLDTRVDRFHTWVPMGIKRINVGTVRKILDRNPNFKSVYGHHSTVPFLETILGRHISANRISIQAKPGDEVIVAVVRNLKSFKERRVQPYFDFYQIRFFLTKEECENDHRA